MKTQNTSYWSMGGRFVLKSLAMLVQYRRVTFMDEVLKLQNHFARNSCQRSWWKMRVNDAHLGATFGRKRVFFPLRKAPKKTAGDGCIFAQQFHGVPKFQSPRVCWLVKTVHVFTNRTANGSGRWNVYVKDIELEYSKWAKSFKLTVVSKLFHLPFCCYISMAIEFRPHKTGVCFFIL